MIDADRAAAALSGKSIGQGNSKGQDVDQILAMGTPVRIVKFFMVSMQWRYEQGRQVDIVA